MWDGAEASGSAGSIVAEYNLGIETGSPTKMNRFFSRISGLLGVLSVFLIGPWSCGVHGEDQTPQLLIVDRSEGKDGLYYCSVRFSKADLVETIGLVLKDRQGNKAGDMLLGTIDTSPTETMAAFFLNHELIKNSFVLIQFSDDRLNLKLIAGEQKAIKKIDGKSGQVPIE